MGFNVHAKTTRSALFGICFYGTFEYQGKEHFTGYEPTPNHETKQGIGRRILTIDFFG